MSTPIKILNQVLKKYSSPMTLNYPSGVVAEKKYSQIPVGLRGILERDKEKCVGCKACYYVCSGRATSIYDEADKRLVDVFLFRCTFCAHCEDACPEEAIKMTQKFELAATSRDDPAAYIQTELELATCKICGKPFAAKKLVKRAFERLGDKIDPLTKESVVADYEKLTEYCPEHRRMNSLKMDTHTKKYVWLEGA